MHQVVNVTLLALLCGPCSASHIRRHHENVMTLSVTQGAGGCFEIGYGSMMVPCCLSVHPGKAKNECGSLDPQETGGAKGWSEECPATAEQANQVIKAQEKTEAPSDEDAAGEGTFTLSSINPESLLVLPA